MNDALDWMFEQLWNTPKDKFEWNAILNKARNMQNEHNKQMITEIEKFERKCIKSYQTNEKASNEFRNIKQGYSKR